MTVLRLAICVTGVYSMFLIWAIAQERFSVAFPSTNGTPDAKFKSILFLNTCQSAAGALSSFIYILLRRKPNQSFKSLIGLEAPVSNGTTINGKVHSAQSNGHAKHPAHPEKNRTQSLLRAYFQTAVLITLAAPFGFAALSHISYPTMVLGKSCKLVPVMIMNVILYRRKFAVHKYLVVFMVTVGITMFMGFSNEGASKKHGSKHGDGTELTKNGLLGITYLLINLIMDGAINSTQDEIFARFKVTGQQMMLFINLSSTIVTASLCVLPLPYIPVLHPSNSGVSELKGALEFIRTHPTAVGPLAGFALTGALGQLFIFETLQHFGSLTLVTITLTRKLFTMLLSVFIYNHKLTPGQWGGAATVFAGIAVEAWVKRKDIHAKRVAQEKEKPKIKSL